VLPDAERHPAFWDQTAPPRDFIDGRKPNRESCKETSGEKAGARNEAIEIYVHIVLHSSFLYEECYDDGNVGNRDPPSFTFKHL